MATRDEAVPSRRTPSSTWLFPQRHDGALSKLADVARADDRSNRIRGLEQILLDVLNHERITSTHRLEGRTLAIEFELGDKRYDIVCVWEDRDRELPFDLVPKDDRRVTVLVFMGRRPTTVGHPRTIVIGYDAILRVLEGRNTWRREIETAI